MEILQNSLLFVLTLTASLYVCESAKINTPRVLLPWFENLYVNFTFEIIEGGCYKWSLSRDDIIDLEALYDDSWGHCSRAARVSVSKTCIPPGSVIILAEEVNTGEILRGDVDVDIISSLKITSTTWKLFLEEAPEAFEVVAYDDQGNKFSTLEGISFSWTVENVGNNYGEDPLVAFVRWRDTDYEAPPGIAELEAKGLKSHSLLLYGQAMGECKVTVCLEDICTDFNLKVVASVALMPATAVIAHGDTLRYKVVRMRAGRLTVQNVVDTLYSLRVPDNNMVKLEDAISLVRGTEIGTTTVFLMSGLTEVATALLTVAEPDSIRVTLRPANLVIYGEEFVIHCVVYDAEGHALTAGEETLIRLSVEGEANIDLIRSTENGTITIAMAQNSGSFTITARLYSIAGKTLMTKIEGQASAVAVEPLEVVPSELFVAWTDSIQEVLLKHRGGGDEPVVWSESETELQPQSSFSLAPTGVITVRGVGQLDVKVQLKKYSHVRAHGRIFSAPPELVQVSSSGQARIGRPHHLHIALTATHPVTGELYNFHLCNCASFSVSLLEGPEPLNVTAATWVQPVEGACCVLQCSWAARGVALVRVWRGRAGDAARVAVRAAPRLRWPPHAAAALLTASAPVLAEGEALVPSSSDSRVAELVYRDGPSPHKYPELQLFTFKCRRKGDVRLEIASSSTEERETVDFEVACAPHVSRIRLEAPPSPGNCSGGPKLWLRPGQEVSVKVTLMDAIGRELLDEHGPRVAWESQPNHAGIEFKATDRLFVETDPEYAPVPVPLKYYQLLVADKQAIGWTGSIKASIPEATANIQARVVAPLQCDPLRVNIAWEGESVSNIATVTGGSGKYGVEAAKGVTASIENGVLTAAVPAPGIYDLVVTDLCVQGERQVIEVNIEEVLNVEVETTRAVCVGGCVPITALVKGTSQRYLSSSGPAEWRTVGNIKVKDGKLCGLQEGLGRVRASLAGVWSPELEVVVFPALVAVPSRARVPPGARLQLRHVGGPPAHLARLHYRVAHHTDRIHVRTPGLVAVPSRACSCGTLAARPRTSRACTTASHTTLTAYTYVHLGWWQYLRVPAAATRRRPARATRALSLPRRTPYRPHTRTYTWAGGSTFARLQLRHDGGPPALLACLHNCAAHHTDRIHVRTPGLVAVPSRACSCDTPVVRPRYSRAFTTAPHHHTDRIHVRTPGLVAVPSRACSCDTPVARPRYSRAFTTAPHTTPTAYMYVHLGWWQYLRVPAAATRRCPPALLARFHYRAAHHTDRIHVRTPGLVAVPSRACSCGTPAARPRYSRVCTTASHATPTAYMYVHLGWRQYFRACACSCGMPAALFVHLLDTFIMVSPTGLVQGLAMGTAHVKLVATDIANVEMASAEAEIEVVPISGLRVHASTQNLLVGSPTPVWVEAAGLTAAALSAVQPPPRVTWTLKDSTTARLYTGHVDDQLERSVAEGLSVRVVPLKPGVITIDVRVRNMGQVAETRSWDSAIEILGISEIRTSVEGFPNELAAGDRLAIAVGSSIRLKSVPRSVWTSYSDGVFDLSPSGEVNTLRPGHGVIVAQHKDDRNNIYRENAIHVEVSVPHYCTAEPSGDQDDDSLRVVLRNSIGRELLAPGANVSVNSPVSAHVRRAANSALGNEIIFTGLDSSGAFMSFQATASGVTVTDEVLVVGADSQGNRIVATGGWAVCVEGVGWRASGAVSLHAGAGVTLCVLTRAHAGRHALRRDRPPAALSLPQAPLHRMEFLAGEWPPTMVPLAFEAIGLTSGPILCTEEQKYALEGVQVELPYTCRTEAPYTAQPVLDLPNGQMGCSIIPAKPVVEPTEVELCAEWGVMRTCIKVLLLPPIQVSHNKVSVANPPATFTVSGHNHALKLVKMTTSPGLKLEMTTKDGEITVTVNVKSETVACGVGHVHVSSRLTAQEITVEVDRECDIACGTLLGAIFSLLKPYLSTLITVIAIAAAYLYVQQRFQSKGQIRMPIDPAMQTVLPQESPSPVQRSRTWSRSPYASGGPNVTHVPDVPVYGDASVLPDNSFSPNSTRTHSRFL
ncbi:unnamed protein product [Parnassius apollo]|uniref:(apollo) hypothetical protein n=1 Tax=Parnassius apollo TaxID=110799 RepID=A0A8S3XUM8_PARAO|nr:unnamed protein product [Parnassius apollo]